MGNPKFHGYLISRF